jgi:hypothetical protein
MLFTGQTVPFCQNLYRNSFTYHCLQDGKTLQFDDAIQFLGMVLFFHFQSPANNRYAYIVFAISIVLLTHLLLVADIHFRLA